MLLSDAPQANVTATAADMQRLVVDRAYFLGPLLAAGVQRRTESSRAPRARAGYRVGEEMFLGTAAGI